ncbi:DUF2848 domain-containing protein [Bradyrhizobium sp. dw_411]|uniref:DUF2848 domain-containing protein n=1 Tax=Bradyrhizobium sp. dw_411 TaxID=2720082 RepID=UPI001BCFBA17|nr:DUF2848 domain-containing protein [Bradyrhizobium sp. dw_411]
MSHTTLKAIFEDGGSARAQEVDLSCAIIAGWTGRDPAALEKHIVELEALGVKRPPTTPVFYRVAATRLTSNNAMEVTGPTSSGEVEFVMLQWQDRLWIGVGSDHTDREAETYDVTVSKQMCDKPVAAKFWAFDAVAAHWDQLQLRSYIIDGDGSRVLYQAGTVAGMLAPTDLLKKWGRPLAEGTLMFGGTLAALGGIRPSRRFEYEIEDPVLGRTLSHGYDIVEICQ